MSGIRAEVKIHSPLSCPVVSVSSAADASGTSIAKASGDGETVTEEFVLDADLPSDLDVGRAESADVREIFSYGSKHAIRFEREEGKPCPCDEVEQFDCPLLDVYARNEALVLVFHVPDIDRLQDVLTELQDNWSDVTVRRLIQSDQDRSTDDLVLVDRSRLTDRQHEVLETAHGMGYFDHPKGANASEVAAELGITHATFTEHLAAAQRKLLTSVMET